MYKGWNCFIGNKSGATEIVKWHWKPNYCSLPQFDPLRFFEWQRDIGIGFEAVQIYTKALKDKIRTTHYYLEDLDREFVSMLKCMHILLFFLSNLVIKAPLDLFGKGR